jgi:hypothetical protein
MSLDPSLRIEGAETPREVRLLLVKIGNLGGSHDRLVEECGRAKSSDGKCLDLRPLLQLRGLSDWLDENKERIKGQIADTYERTMADGIIWRPRTISGRQAHIEEIYERSRDAANAQIKTILDMALVESEKDGIVSFFNRGLENVQIDDRSWTVEYVGDKMDLRVTMPDR